jgi:hypothetical protein
MKKVLLISILFISAIYAYLFFCISNKNSLYLSEENEIVSIEKQNIDNEFQYLIKKINERNEAIRNFSVDSMPIKFQQNKISLRVNGQLALQKDKHFRLIISHKLSGKELDIGSNENIFWFWSRRMKPPVYNFASYDNLSKTMLRSTLNPNWFMEALDFGKLSFNSKAYKYNDNLMLSEERNAINGEQLTSIILIDPKKEVVLGKYLYDSKNRMLASCEYSDFANQIPNKINICWHEENIKMIWDLSKIKINQNINPGIWEMPNVKNKINIGE